jgi:DNA-binding transcriptional ArsR family regulator
MCCATVFSIVESENLLEKSRSSFSVHLSVSVVRRKLPAPSLNTKFYYSYLITFRKLIGASRFVEIQLSKNQIGEYMVRHNLFH